MLATCKPHFVCRACFIHFPVHILLHHRLLVDCSLFIVLLIVWMYFNVLCYIFCYFSLPDLFLSLSSLFPCFHLLLCMLRTSILSASFCVQFSSAVVLSPSAVPLLKILLLGQLCSIRMSYRSSIH